MAVQGEQHDLPSPQVGAQPQQQPPVTQPVASTATPKVAQPVLQNNPVPLISLDKGSAYIECPFCHVRGRTTVSYENTDATACAAVGCCCVLGVFGVWMPFVFHWGADIDHHCGACTRLVVHKDHNGAVTIHGPTPPPNEKVGYVAVAPMQQPVQREVGAQEDGIDVAPPQYTGPVQNSMDAKPTANPNLPISC